MIRARVAAAALISLFACNRVPSENEAPARRLELRDARGQSRQTLFDAGGGAFRWTDAQDGAGRILREPEGARRAEDRVGRVVETASAAEALELRGPGGRALRLTRESGGLRLGDGAGIPIARTRIEKDETLVRDAGGQVILRARRAGGRIVVTDRGGTAIGFVVGDAAPEAAALVWLPSLSAAERALLLTAAEVFR